MGGALLSVMVMMRFKWPEDFFFPLAPPGCFIFFYFFSHFFPMVMDGQFPSFSPLMKAEQAVCPQSRHDGLDESLTWHLTQSPPPSHIFMAHRLQPIVSFVVVVWNFVNGTFLSCAANASAHCHANLLLLRPSCRNSRVGFPLPASRPGRPADVIDRRACLTLTTR